MLINNENTEEYIKSKKLDKFKRKNTSIKLKLDPLRERLIFIH